MIYRTINEDNAVKNWSSVITESTGIQDPKKLAWMSKMLEVNHRVISESKNFMNVNENMIGGYGVQTPASVPGMGAVAFPSVGQANGDIMAQNYQKGSGDMPQKQIAFAMNIASYTLGLDTLPVIPMEFPSMMYGYMDYVYSANLNKSQDEQGKSDIFFKVSGVNSGKRLGRNSKLKQGDRVAIGLIPAIKPDETSTVELTNVTQAIYGIFYGLDRVSAKPIIKFEGMTELTKQGALGAEQFYKMGAVRKDIAPSVQVGVDATVGYTWAMIKFNGENSENVLGADDKLLITDQYISGIEDTENKYFDADLVSAVDMVIAEFSKPNATYDGVEDYGATRADGEQGTQNIISLRLFSTSVEAKTEEVLGEVTRTQKRDMNAYGLDAIGNLFKAAQNELMQVMNKDILRTEFRLGVTNAVQLYNSQGFNANLYIGDPSKYEYKSLSEFGVGEFRDIHGTDMKLEFDKVFNAESNSSAENNVTRSRRVLSKINECSNIISTVSRNGAGDFVVTNARVASWIQDIKNYTINPFDNDVQLGGKTMYTIGKVNGIQVYVDPLMKWTDTRVCVGRKGDEMDSGLKMFIYTMGETTATIAEATMADKILVTNRYALVPCGFHPQTNYITFAIKNDYEN